MSKKTFFFLYSLSVETFLPERWLFNSKKKQLSWSRLSLISCQNQISFNYSAQNHHHVASVGFITCTVSDTLCPQTLDSNEEKVAMCLP